MIVITERDPRLKLVNAKQKKRFALPLDLNVSASQSYKTRFLFSCNELLNQFSVATFAKKSYPRALNTFDPKKPKLLPFENM